MKTAQINQLIDDGCSKETIITVAMNQKGILTYYNNGCTHDYSNNKWILRFIQRLEKCWLAANRD